MIIWYNNESLLVTGQVMNSNAYSFSKEELSLKETVFLNTDREMPLLGLGVYKTADSEAETAITAAVNAGYRLIDTASAYKNEESIGKAIAK